MSKPWDNETTPIADRFSYRVVLAEDIRPLERRLRHAERLLELCAGHTLTKYQEQALSHLEAAGLEDGQKELI